MPFIYNETIESKEKENRFRITWKNMGTNSTNYFEKLADFTPEVEFLGIFRLFLSPFSHPKSCAGSPIMFENVV